MHLSNILLRKRNKIILFLLSIVVALVLSYPFLQSSLSGVFYVIDPEVMYISNALSFISRHIIAYRDHPGTPTIVALSVSYFPLRVYSKFIEHQNFILWSFNNIRFLFFYTRVVMICFFSLSLYTYMFAVSKIVKSKTGSILALLGLFVFPFFLRLSGDVLGESLSFLGISFWLLLFFYFTERKSNRLLLLMSLVAGFSLAVKFNNIVIVIASLGLIFSLPKLNIKKIFIDLSLNLPLQILGFVAGTWFIRRYYNGLFLQILKVIGSSGNSAAHGVGGGSFLNVADYVQYFERFWRGQTLISIMFVFLVAVVIILFRRKRLQLTSPVSILFCSMVFSVLFIAKYPLTYYQFPNFLVFIFVAVYVVGKYFNKIIPYLILFLIPVAFINLKAHYVDLWGSINVSKEINNYQINHPSKNATLWDYAPVTDFIYVWIRQYGSGVFDEQLKKERPDILILISDYKTVYLDDSKSIDIFNVCWDKLFIREERAKILLAMYPGRKLVPHPIGNTGIWEIDSVHCASPKPKY